MRRTLIEELSVLINNLTDGDFKSPEYDEDDIYRYLNCDKAEEIEELAAGCLIESGRPDYESMRLLKSLCPKIIDIGPGDSDSFGWLTGVIKIKGDDGGLNAIVYG